MNCDKKKSKMVLKSKSKNVAKIVAAAFSSVSLSLSPTYQLNGVEDGIPVMENVRDGLKSNVRTKNVR